MAKVREETHYTLEADEEQYQMLRNAANSQVCVKKHSNEKMTYPSQN
jgi:hypothetical protein